MRIEFKFKMMKKLAFIFIAIAFAISASQASHFATDCPKSCICQNTFCRKKGKKEICKGVSVDCFARNLTSIPEGIPLNVTGLRLSNNFIRQINFNAFEKLTRLTNLIIDNNNATELIIGRPIKRLERLSLSGNHLVNLPSNKLTFLKRLTDLNLQNNWIEDLQYIRFPRKLEMLNLNNNRIRHLSGGTFTKLKLLRVLKMNNNSISNLYPKALLHLTQLESFEMEHNRLQRLTKNTFTSLPQGWYLNLRNNEINDIHPLAFRLFGYKNENHHQIHLENNELHFVERETVNILTSRANRYSLYFGGNPIFCDCNLINLRDEASPLFGDKDRMLCDAPKNFTGTSLEDLHIEDCCF